MDFRRYLRSISEVLATVRQVLDWVLGIAGRVAILAGAAMVVYAIFQLFFGADEPGQSRAGKVLELIDANWKAILLVLLPLLYLPLKTFLDSITEVRFGGTRFRRGKYPPDEPDNEKGDAGG